VPSVFISHADSALAAQLEKLVRDGSENTDRIQLFTCGHWPSVWSAN